jgi:hypothetical protein
MKLIAAVMISIIFFITLGFPKEDTNKINFYLEDKIQVSIFCTLIFIINENISTFDCFNDQNKFCEYNILSNDAQIILDKELKKLQIDNKNPIIFIDEDFKNYKIYSINECKNQFMFGRKVYNSDFQTLRILPPINLLFLIFSVFSILSILRNHKD